MEIIDKKNVLLNLHADKKIKLELGCGSKKKHDDAIGIDALDYPCVDIVGDIFDVLQKIPDETIHEIYSYHFFEHVENLSLLMKELERVIIHKGKLKVVVPHFSNPYYYSDYTHKNPFGLYSFSYFTRDSIFTRKAPTYKKTPVFNLTKVILIFKSPRPFYFRWLFKKMFQYIFNLNNYMKELYEENFCYFIPCYEIQYEMIKEKRD
jgi:ubiquinone/menaquinone biosynthesis C-methylase UbiE